MREGPYEVILLNKDDIMYKETVINNKTYSIVRAGDEYNIKVNVYRGKDGFYPFKQLRIGLFVDGIDVQYWKRIDLSDESMLPKDPNTPVSSRFFGFKLHATDILRFNFSFPKLSSDFALLSDSEKLKQIGSIRVIFHEAHFTAGIFDNICITKEVPRVQEISDNKKFWQQASVATTAGSILMNYKEQFHPLLRWVNVNHTPDFEMTLHYHTKDMIELIRGIPEPKENITGNKRPYTNENISFNIKSEGGKQIMEILDDDINQSSVENDGSDDNQANQIALVEQINEDVSILTVKKKKNFIDIN